MKYTELKKLIKEQIEAVKAENLAEISAEDQVEIDDENEEAAQDADILRNPSGDNIINNMTSLSNAAKSLQQHIEGNKKQIQVYVKNNPSKANPIGKQNRNLKEDMMADPVSISFFIGTVATLVTGFTAAVWKGMKDNEKQKLTKAVKELKPKEVKAIAEKAVEEVHAN